MAQPRLPVLRTPGMTSIPAKIETPRELLILPEDGYPLLQGFESVSVPEHKRLVVAIDGLQKTGKTSLALRFPKPLVMLNLDFSLEELVVQHPELWDDNTCQQARLQMNELTDPSTWGALLKEFHEKYIRALEFAEAYGGTVIVDTATQLWQVVQAVNIEHVRAQRIARVEARTWASEAAKDDALERAEKQSRLDWGLANAFMGGILRRAMHCKRANAVFIHRVKEIYNEKGQPTGTYGFHGYGETPAIVQFSIRTLRVPKNGGGYEHRMEIRDCRFGSQWQGFQMPVPVDPYGTLVGMFYPDKE